jgi:hypothetical protein
VARRAGRAEANEWTTKGGRTEGSRQSQRERHGARKMTGSHATHGDPKENEFDEYGFDFQLNLTVTLEHINSELEPGGFSSEE